MTNLIPKPEIPHTHTHTQEVQANITDEYRCKNSQQNISKQNSTIYWKDHTRRSSGIYPRDAWILQYPQINQCYIYTTSTS